MKLLRILGILLILATAALKSQAGDKKKAEPNVPVVPVSIPVQRTVTDHADFTGRTEAQELVTIKPRVNGYLVKVAFREGAEVKKGDVLFQIDPRPYEAQVAAAQAKLVLAEASLKLARTANQRLKTIGAKAPGAVSAQELDHAQGQEDLAVAVLEFDRANLQAKKIDLDFTQIRAPISGRLGRAQMTAGNLAIQDATKLTTITNMDPMYVYFNMDERTWLRIRQSAAADKAKAETKTPILILMGLASDDGYPHTGAIDFVDTRFDAKAGGLPVRVIFKNPSAKDGAPLMLPGMAVHVRVPVGKPYEALLVIDRAIVTDQGAKFVYVLEANNKVAFRRVTVGQLEPDGLRVISQGLKKDDAVIIGGFKLIRPGATVEPERIVMPTLK